MTTKIKQIEPQFAQKLTTPPVRSALKELNYYVPDHYQLRVSLLEPDGKKKMRSNSSADKWSVDFGRIQIWFEPTKPPLRDEREFSPEGKLASGSDENRARTIGAANTYVHRSEADPKALNVLVVALDRAESKPGWNFVPL